MESSMTIITYLDTDDHVTLGGAPGYDTSNDD
jgi:hypothetical protein